MKTKIKKTVWNCILEIECFKHVVQRAVNWAPAEKRGEKVSVGFRIELIALITAFFDFCRINNFAKTLLHHEVPQYYTWQKNKFAWRKRDQEVAGFPGIRKEAALGRVYNVHPTQIKCFYLRMLFLHVRGPTAFETLRTVNGVICTTYQGACKELDLLVRKLSFQKQQFQSQQQNWECCLLSSLYFASHQIRSIYGINFLMICVRTY